MKKIPTLFLRDPNSLARVTRELNPACAWVAAGEGVATVKYDGTCLMLDTDGEWWSRREVKPGRTPPPGWTLVDHDPTTGKQVGWEPIAQSPFAKYHAEALTRRPDARLPVPGTFELVGPAINGNPERFEKHTLIRHAAAAKLSFVPCSWDRLRQYLGNLPCEGIVWHHPDGRMAKLKGRDFGYARWTCVSER